MGTYAGKLKVGGRTIPIASTLYGTCTTAAATAEKVVTCADFDTLITGVTIHIRFSNANSVANPTLNVNNTGAIAIKRYGTTAPSTSAASSWNAGSVITFTYDGTYWMMNGWLNSTYSNNSESYNSTTTSLCTRGEKYTWNHKSKIYYCTTPTFSSLPQSYVNDLITAQTIILDPVLSNPAAQLGDWNITASDGSITISGTIASGEATSVHFAFPTEAEVTNLSYGDQ